MRCGSVCASKAGDVLQTDGGLDNSDVSMPVRSQNIGEPVQTSSVT